ncbi:hypothetical protein [Actinoplanes sp. NPDC051851]|uniref:hypothetical protein n=1 Tax=Actinoplanes sp. NPDC051851 TaxID=3154753 RepID=UPI00343E03A5
MNLSLSTLRRTGSVVAGTALGLVGVVSSAMPALACHVVVQPQGGSHGSTSCVNPVDGSWVVNWEIKSSESYGGTVTRIDARPSEYTLSVTGLAVGDEIPANQSATVTQTLSGAASWAEINVSGTWQQGGNKQFGGSKGDTKVSKPTKECDTGTPSGSPSPTPSETVSESPSATPSESTSATPSESVSTSATPSESVSTSPTPSQTTTTPTDETPVTEPTFVYDTTCDTLTVGVEVPSDWDESVTVTFAPSTGDTQTVTAAPGETKTVDFDASEGLTVTATPEGYEDEAATIAYEAPDGCDDELALTGAAAGSVAGGAAVLLIAGVGLFFMARRRKLRFTA